VVGGLAVVGGPAVVVGAAVVLVVDVVVVAVVQVVVVSGAVDVGAGVVVATDGGLATEVLTSDEPVHATSDTAITMTITGRGLRMSILCLYGQFVSRSQPALGQKGTKREPSAVSPGTHSLNATRMCP
jgi:hypothetical protein